MAGMEMTAEFLAAHPLAKWGWVIYRTTYRNDDEWHRFMDILNTRVRLDLESYGYGYLFPRIDWCVQDDPALEGASDDDVRSRFREWVANSGEVRTTYLRTDMCIRVCQYHVELMLAGPSAEEGDPWGKTWVDLVSADENQGYFRVGTNYLIPRVWSLLRSLDWDGVSPGESGDVFCH